jgi:hypothetical protein
MLAIDNIDLRKLPVCQQQWDKMPTHEKGRLCQQCNKTIVDFRHLSRKQIAETHAFSNEAVCGAYRQNQLTFDPTSKPRSKRFFPVKQLYFGILSWLFTNQSHAQTQKTPLAPTEIVAHRNQHLSTLLPDTTTSPTSKDSIWIQGKVTDEIKEPMAFATVFVEGSQQGVSTDFDGLYQIDLTEALDTNEFVTLVFSHVGYGKVRKTISRESERKLDVTFTESTEMIAFSVVIRPTPFYKRIWFRIKRPFTKKQP